ncbi:sensor histidine kinase [Rugamonas sp.]|uniref:sensor histidine kinase n=1 Tax=Rugamonas sp. TaxID=1926287 RepID=UPI00345BBA3A
MSAWLQIRANTMHEMEVVQGLSRGLAKSIALDTQVTGEDGLRPDAVRRLFDQLMMVNPSVEVYLLDPAGRVIGHAAPAGHLKRDRVGLAPLLNFLGGGMLPILGDDPRSAGGRKVFSAAALHAGGRDVGYVYVVLQGEAHDQLAARGAVSSVLRITLWSMALVALLGLLAGLIAFRLITRPLRRLTDTMELFDARAEPLVMPALAPPGAGARDEIAILEAAYRQMAGRIAEQWQELRQLDLDRRELVANISHDLRTPLTSLHGYLETLSARDGALDAAERQRYLGIALAQSRKVGRLAQTLFELARLEHGFVELAPEDFLLSDLIQDVFQKFELQAETKGVRLLAQLPSPAPLVTADLGMIERVLTNLLDNAIRHTPAGGSVDVSVAARGETVLVTVSDTGPGLPQELRANLFRRPFALTGERRDGGLGLLIVHRILQLHHSRIELQTVAGRGATFSFELAVGGEK